MRLRKAKGGLWEQRVLVCTFTCRVCGKNECHIYAVRPPFHYVKDLPRVNDPGHSLTRWWFLEYIHELLDTASNER